MYIRFQKLMIEGFQSIGDPVELDLENQGLTLIKGINEYEEKASSNGSGKCFGKGTKVQMYDGTIKNVEDIQVNDIVLGWDSTPRKVLETHKGIGNLYKIKHYEDEYSYICNDVHTLTLRTPVKCGKRKILDVELPAYNEKPNWWKKQTNQFVMPMFYGKDKEFFIDPYTLGLWLGDGSVGKPEICNADIEILDYWRSLATKYNLHLWEYQKPNNKALTIHLSQRKGVANPFVSELKRLGLFNTKRIPKSYLTSSYNNRMLLLAGILDTDGYYDQKQHRYELAQVRKDLTDDIIQLIRSLGFRVTRKIKLVNGKPYQRLYITGNHLHELPMKVPHKIAKSVSKQRADSISFSVEDAGFGEYFGFSIEGDGRFLLNTGLVVHNSSVVESICWCLFGKTSAGIANVKNRYYKNGCTVTVTFKKNTESYSITRSLGHKVNGTGVKLIRNDTKEDLSCRNKTDTDKIIKNSVLPFTQDIFLSTIFLSQGFSGRLSLLTPSARKVRLEVLANIEESVTSFKTSLADRKNQLSTNISELSNKISYLTGQLELYTKEKADIVAIKDTAPNVVPDCDINVLESKVSKLETTIKELTSTLANKRIAYNKTQISINEKQKLLSSIVKEWTAICSKLNGIHVSSECPMCHRIMSVELSEEVESALKEEAELKEPTINELKKEIQTLKEQYDTTYQEAEPIKSKIISLEGVLSTTKNTINTYNTTKAKNASLQAKLQRLPECTENIQTISKQINKIKEVLASVTIKYEITDHMLKLITKEFRGFLLSDIVLNMNTRLKEYSKQLFENEKDCINISTDNTNLDIYLGDNLYESLSGGEKKKVDLALVLAQRDIALDISGFQCNLMILDEILENMDEVSSSASLTLLGSVSEDIESMYLISHNNYAIPVDQTLVVTKHPNQISTINLQ